MITNVLKVCLVLFILGLGSNVTFAQEQEEVEISDEELRRYAIAMDSVERMKQAIIDMMTTEVENNANISGARFNELSKIIDDSVKLAEANATPEEIAFINGVKARKDQMTEDINTQFRSLAIDYIGDGGRIYKKIQTALKTDEEVKDRYEDMLEDLKEEREDAAEDAEDAAEDAEDTAEELEDGK